jgi:hypothetical protein
MMIVDVLSSFIANVDCTLKIKAQTFSANPDTVTLYVENTLFARQGTMINFDGIADWPIDSVNHSDNSIVVLTNNAPATVSLTPPAFVHGTPYSINQQLDKEVSYPFVYLLEVIRERIPEVDSRFATIPTLRLFFLDEANFRDWDSEELYSLAVTPQRIWCDYVLAKIRTSFRTFGSPANIEITSFSKFGQYTDSKGAVNSLFNKTLSGVELRMDLPFVADKCCR